MMRYRWLITTLVIFSIIELQAGDCSKHFTEINDCNDSDRRVESLRNVNFLVGIAERGANARNEISSEVRECAKDLRIFLEAVDTGETWATKMIDAFGNMPRSFIWGNNFWFSSPELCSDINEPLYISLSPSIPRITNKNLMNMTSPFKVHFQMVYFNYTTPMQADLKQQHEPHIEIGLCVPVQCPKEAITNWAQKYFEDNRFIPQRIYDINMTTVDSKVPEFKSEIFSSTGFILFTLIVVTVSSLAGLAEIMCILKQRRSETHDKNTVATETFRGEKFLRCFSLRENVPRVLQATAPKEFVSILAGLRTIVCLWVTLLHIFYFSMFTMDNILFLYATGETFIHQPVFQACYYVDVFFTVSAFLMTYNLLSNKQRVREIKSNKWFQNLKLYMKFVIHRIFRLTPVLVLTLVASDFVYDIVDMSSPFYLNEDHDLYCKKNWWYTLLYINNGLSIRKMCLTWSWYLACEMQFYIFFLAIIFIYIKNETVGKAIFITSTLVLMTVSFLCYYSNGITFQFDVMSVTAENVYIKPWTRIPPYFAGVLTGWFLYRTRTLTIKLSEFTRTAFWVVATMIHLVVIFMTYWRETPVWIVATIMSFGRGLFGIFIGSLISICQLGYGGAFAKIMGARLFLYLDKFVYSTYMVAPIVITLLSGLRNEPSTFSVLSAISDIFPVMFISHIFAMLTTLFVEIPFQRLSSQYILKKM